MKRSPKGLFFDVWNGKNVRNGKDTNRLAYPLLKYDFSNRKYNILRTNTYYVRLQF